MLSDILQTFSGIVYLTILVPLLATIWRWKQNWNLPPGPWNLPIIGYLPFIDPKHPYLTFTKLRKKYGPIYYLRLGSIKTVVISDPAIIKEALKRNEFNVRANLYVTHGIFQGYGIIAAEGERWKEQRKFALNCLKNLGMVKLGAKRSNLEERILIGVRKAITDLSDNKGKPVDTFDLLLDSLGNVINSIVLGKTWRSKDPQWLYLKGLIDQGVKLMGVAGPLNFLPFLRWLPKYRRDMEFLQDGIRRTYKIYDTLYKLRTVNGEEDVLSMFKKEVLTGSTYFTIEQMYRLVADLVGAGTDTTFSTLRWFFLYVAVDTDIQDKIQEELDSVLIDRDEPCLDDMQHLPYLEACLKETQRIRSIVPLGIPHGTSTDTELEGYRIPKDTMILPLQWAVHMNPEVWENPDEFQPERFIDENNKSSKKHSHFIPFQTGKRMCPGDELAHMLLFLFSAGILKIFNIRLGQEYDAATLSSILQGDCGLTLAPGPHSLKFTYRFQPKPLPRDLPHPVYY